MTYKTTFAALMKANQWRGNMTAHYPRIYKLLKRVGHSPFKAAEIILDAARGRPHAMLWVRTVFKCRHQEKIPY